MRTIITIYLLLVYNTVEANFLRLLVVDLYRQPIPEVIIQINEEESISDSKGECVFNLEQGTYTLRLFHESYINDDLAIHVSGDTLITLVLTQYERLIGANIRAASKQETSALSSAIISSDYIKQQSSNSLMTALSGLAGVNAIGIGQGFSKPVIRGLSFNRVAVIENNIKQQGQQWGADHGLEIDQLNVDKVEIIKGPAALEYGSDAMGGVVVISPQKDYSQGVRATFLVNGRSNNALLGGSLGMHYRKNNKYLRTRLTYQNYADYKVPADSFTYLGYVFPLQDSYLKNTAGYERNIHLATGMEGKHWEHNLSISNINSKMGFFAGAHGFPSLDKLKENGNHRDIELPYQTVNHFKIITNNIYEKGKVKLYLDASFQNNLRKEYSIPHSHGNKFFTTGNLELEMNLHTLSALSKLETSLGKLYLSIGPSFEYQDNSIGGYSFLLPAFNQLQVGMFLYGKYPLTQKLSLAGGLRMDYGYLHIHPYQDTSILVDYYRAPELKKSFVANSFNAGINYELSHSIYLKMNFGKSFRMPTANELGSNGIHHGTFRYELGDSTLQAEQSYQLDLGLEFHAGRSFSFSLGAFYNHFPNFIFLEPSGEYSLKSKTGEVILLPDVGQIYKYKQTQAQRFGGEATLKAHFTQWLTLISTIEYVYAKNMQSKHPIPFTPPLGVGNQVSFHHKSIKLSVTHQYLAEQSRVRNEQKTPSSNIFGFNLSGRFFERNKNLLLTFGIQNILNTRYYNHLSFYRYLNLPEQGRNFTLTLYYTLN